MLGSTDSPRSYDLVVDTAGADATATFAARAGDRISIKVSNSTVGTAYVHVRDPDGETTKGGPRSISGRTAFLDTITLTKTGTHTLRLDPDADHTGHATILINQVPANAGTITPGTATTIMTTVPGEDADRTFAARAGDRISIKVSDSTVGTAYVHVLDPDGETTKGGPRSISGRTAFLDTITLTKTGTHTLRLDPDADHTGHATILINRS